MGGTTLPLPLVKSVPAPESTIIAPADGAQSYTFILPSYPADEYGKILLRRVIDHVLGECELFPDGDVSLRVCGEAYEPQIACDATERSPRSILSDAAQLLQEYDTIVKRSVL